jgi:hypothetical protein
MMDVDSYARIIYRLHYFFLLHPKQFMESGVNGRTGAHALRLVVMEHNIGLGVAIIHRQVMEAAHVRDLVHRLSPVTVQLVVSVDVSDYEANLC